MPAAQCRAAFLAHVRIERRLSPLTVKAYASDLADFGRFAGTAEASAALLRAYLADMTEARRLSVATVKRRIAALRCYFAWRAEAIGTPDPTLGWQVRMKRPRRLPRTLSREELNRLVAGGIGQPSTGAPLDLLLRLMTATGIRIGELCALDAADVAFDGASLRIRGKGARDRMVYVPNRALSGALRQRAQAGRGNMPTQAPLFTSPTGERLSPASVRRRLHRLARERGCGRRITPHMFRHTAATLLIEEGVDIRHIQRLLGHASIATTEIYTHIADESLRRTLERVDVLNRL